MHMNEINLYRLGAWLFAVGLGLIFLCAFIPEIPTDLITEIVSWIWAISWTITLGNFLGDIVIKLRKRKEEPEEELKNDE